jgi:hypothetical protein
MAEKAVGAKKRGGSTMALLVLLFCLHGLLCVYAWRALLAGEYFSAFVLLCVGMLFTFIEWASSRS